MTITIPAAAIPAARAEIAKLYARVARAAVKAGAPAPATPELVVRAERTAQRCAERCGAPIEHGWCTQGHPARSFTLADVEITGARPCIAGWTLLAVIEPISDAGNLTRRVPGAPEDVDLAPYADAGVGARCEHCGTRRRRTETFVLRHEDGAVKQVGRTCLAAFLGVDPRDLLARLAWADAIRALGEPDGEGGGFGAPSAVPMDEFLAWTAACVRLDGFRSRAKAREQAGTTATADQVWGYCNPPPRMPPKERAEREAHTPTTADAERAAAALEWARGLTGASDFERNLAILATLAYVDRGQTGFAAAIVSGYNRHLGDVAERASRPASRHVGTVGARIDVEVTVLRMFSFGGQWGTTTRVIMRADDGAVLVWKASGVPDFDCGDRVSLRGTVKTHDEYQGTPQTVLTRCKATKMSP